MVHVSRFNCTFYIRCLWTFISGPTGGSCWQVLLYSYARGPKTWICCPTSGLCQQVLLYMQYNGSPDIDMWSYWWSMLVGFTIHVTQGVPRHGYMVLLVVNIGSFYYNHYAGGPKSWICGPISGLCCQVWLYMLYNGSPDMDMWYYWWFMLAGFTVHVMQGSQDMDTWSY